MKILLSFVAAFAASGAFAGEMNTVGSSEFAYTGLQAAQKLSAPLPEPQFVLPTETAATPEKTETGPAITDASAYLLGNCGKKNIISHPKSQAEYDEFYARFAAILKGAGMTITSAKFDPLMSVINYESSNGLALREFIGDALKYDGANPAAVEKDMESVKALLEKNNLPVLASYMLKVGFIRPAYVVYYLTKYAERAEDEKRIRVMKTTDNDIDFDLLSGVNIVRKDEPWSMAYIDREIGFVSRWGRDEKDINERLQKRVEELEKLGKHKIGSRIYPVNWTDFPEFKFVYHLYFYQ